MNKSCIEVSLNESSTNQNKEGTYNEEKSDDTECSSPNARSSPEANCPICLGKPQNKSFTDSCLHQFCFTCLLEWSKVKAECPLCKQSFKSIIHNVRSIEDYEQYYLSTAPAEDGLGIFQVSRYEPNRPREPFRYRTTAVTTYLDYFVRLEEAISMHVLPSIPTHSASTHWQRRRQIGTSDFRRTVYQQGLWVQRTRDVTGRFRDCSPEFYRENPASLHRLVPWLNRELNVLCNDNEQHVQYVMSQILEQISQIPIRSPRFSAFMAPYLGRHTEHFIHEFYSFASSPYDLIAYDRFANYVGLDATAAHHISDDDANDSDVQVVALLSPPSPTNSIHLDSDSDDCVVVDCVPPRPASPEVITLDSDPEDDVVQVKIHIETDHNRPGPSRRPPLKRNWLKVKNVQMEKSSNDNVNVSINIAHSSRTRSSSSDTSSSSWNPSTSKSDTSKRKTKLTKRRTKSKSKTTTRSKSKAKVSKKVNRDRSASPVLTLRKRKRSAFIKPSSEDNSDDDSNKLEIITDPHSSSESSDESYKPRLRSVVFKSTVKPEPCEVYSDVDPQPPSVPGTYWNKCRRSYDYKSDIDNNSRGCSRAEPYGPSCSYSYRRRHISSSSSTSENKPDLKFKYYKKRSKRDLYM